MKGVIFSGVGAAPEIVDTLSKPEPADDQVLVKSLWTAINPVDTFMSASGILVAEWPLVLGVDAAGIIVSAGATAQSKYNLKTGSYVCGCTRLGNTAYSTCQDYYLMDAAVTMPKPSNVTVQQSATLGVGTYTASLGLFGGMHIPLPDPKNLPTEKDEYVIILGGSSSVGKFAIQLAKACGFKVLASASAKSKDTITELGAEMFDYKLPLDEQAKAVMDITGGKFTRILDAVAENDPVLAKALFKQIEGQKYFSTTNDWSGIADFEGGKSYLIKLGEVGRPNATELNKMIASYVPIIVGLVEDGKVKPSAVEIIGGEEGGFESAIEAFRYQQSGKGGSRKVVVRIGSE